MVDTGFIKGLDIWYERAIKSIKKAETKFKPIYEGFTNSLESLFRENEAVDTPKIIIRLFHRKILVGGMLEFDYIEIEDNGIGFTDENYKRFKTWGDDRKGMKNRGAGRVQLLHLFGKSEYYSIFKNDDGKYKERKFYLSKSEEYLKNNAIIYQFATKDADSSESKTILKLKELLNETEKKEYDELTTNKLKEALLKHYLPWFCIRRNDISLLKIEQYVDGELKSEEAQTITSSDIPEFNKEEQIVINYSKMSSDGKEIINSEKTEALTLHAIEIQKNELSENSIKLVIKSEVVENKEIEITCLAKKDTIENKRYLFFISGKYFDESDGASRGDFNITTTKEFKKKYADPSLFEKEEILSETIEDIANKKIEAVYPEIRKNKEDQNAKLDKLKSMFLLNDTTLNTITCDLHDTDADILKKVYKADSEIAAQNDAKIKKQMDTLNTLALDEKNYEENFNKIISELVKEIPQQNRTSLTRYVARRKLVLELFDKILNREMENQKKEARNVDEKLLHNLIFQQSTDDPEKSDLWVINEEFIYFQGTSDKKIEDVFIDKNKLLKDNLTEEEEAYRLKQKGDANLKRPDILLFPAEGKCIILEFKSPEVNVSDHINQINRYASLINNLSKKEHNFISFYGYLIGENIDVDDVNDNDSDFLFASNFNYLYRPYKRLKGKFGKKDGALYTEIIKYSTLLERAKQRNKIFIDKLEVK
ncbi:ATP-binding protein [bacterium]|nr:ATP-binding protein [bacterium]